VRVVPGTGATRIVITIAKSCRHVAPERAAVAAPKPKRKVAPPKPKLQAHAAKPVPAAPVAREAAVSPSPPASPPPPRATPKPKLRPAPTAPRPSLDPHAASTKVADLVAAAPVPSSGDAQYEVMLALLLAMLGAAAVWSYGGRYRYRYWRWR
jgi:hypothetical protein